MCINICTGILLRKVISKEKEIKKLLHLMTSEAAPAYPSPRNKVPLGQTYPTTAAAPVNREEEKDDPTWPTPELYDHAQNYYPSKDQEASSPSDQHNATTTAAVEKLPKSKEHCSGNSSDVKSYISSDFLRGILLGATIVLLIINKKK